MPHAVLSFTTTGGVALRRRDLGSRPFAGMHTAQPNRQQK
jgi:hypothetical protein